MCWAWSYHPESPKDGSRAKPKAVPQVHRPAPWPKDATYVSPQVSARPEAFSRSPASRSHHPSWRRHYRSRPPGWAWVSPTAVWRSSHRSDPGLPCRSDRTPTVGKACRSWTRSARSRRTRSGRGHCSSRPRARADVRPSSRPSTSPRDHRPSTGPTAGRRDRSRRRTSWVRSSGGPTANATGASARSCGRTDGTNSNRSTDPNIRPSSCRTRSSRCCSDSVADWCSPSRRRRPSRSRTKYRTRPLRRANSHCSGCRIRSRRR